MIGPRIVTVAEFAEHFPMLDSTLIAHVHSNMPPEWHAILRDGTANTWGWHAIPSDLFDGEDDEGPRQPQYAVHTPQTLVTRPLVRTTELRVKTAYTALVAADFRMPRSLDPSTGQAKHADLFTSVPEAKRRQALARAVKCTKHPAVPLNSNIGGPAGAKHVAEMLRVTRNLTELGSIPEGSELAKELKRLIRKADPDIIATFNASYEGDTFNAKP